MTIKPATIDAVVLKSAIHTAWGIGIATFEPLGGEADTTLRATSTDGQRYCIKYRGVDPNDPSLDLELSAMTHLVGCPSLTVPYLLSTADGRNRHSVDSGTVWIMPWLDGHLVADLPHRPPALLRDLGATARALSTALSDFSHPAANRTHHWDVRSAHTSIQQHLDQLTTVRQRAIADRTLALLDERVHPVIDQLPTSIVHQDLNDHNVIVNTAGIDPVIAGVIDFGDILHSATITELVVPMAYAMLRTAHPIDAAAQVAAGWFGSDQPTDAELTVLFPLALGRLVVNASTWAARRGDRPEYAEARSAHTWRTLDQLLGLPQAFIDESLHLACGGAPAVAQPPSGASSSTFFADLTTVDLDPHNDAFDTIDPTDADAVRAAVLPAESWVLGHDSVRLDLGGHADGDGGPATVQLGLEFGLAEGSALPATAPGTIIESGAERLVIEHTLSTRDWWLVWTGVNSSVTPGSTIDVGETIGAVATGSTPSVQLLTFRPAPYDHIPNVIRPADRAAWTQLSIDPRAVLGMSLDDPPPAATESVTTLRDQRLASSQRYYYREPMTLVRAIDSTFVDANAHFYLDAINNVTHVGHGNRQVVEAAHRQMLRLNTNSRFVYKQMGEYADRLASLLPDPLNVVFLVCTGSEANDLALRISRQVTGREDIMVVDGAYHGNTTTVTGISPNRYKGPGGDGPPPTTHEVEQPNRYRGPFGYDDPDAGAHYAASVEAVAAGLVARGRPPAAFIAESLMGTAGQVVYPERYLPAAFAAVRSHGGLCISDEVQVGFGRLGTHFWGFEVAGVVPDIVTMGKPMGNGHPIAAVVTSREIADAFDQGMKYFNTFGGNPVSCAIAGAVLDEISDRGLQQHAREVGARFRERLESLRDVDDRVGDVRGQGLYLGVEFVENRTTKEPATALTAAVCERMRERGVIVYPNGVHGNCLKIKPPMPFTLADVDRFVDTLAHVLLERA